MKSAGLRAGTYAVRLRGTLWPFIVTLLSALNGYLHKKQRGKIVLTEIAKLTPFTVRQLGRLRDNGFVMKPHGNKGKRKAMTKLSDYSWLLDNLLRSGITNSSVILERLREQGYKGGLTIVKDYIANHRDLVPAPRVLAIANPNRGRRYDSPAGEMFQMDWGFIRVSTDCDETWQFACLAIVCHHCGFRYIEFFTSARQENMDRITKSNFLIELEGPSLR